MSRSPPPTKGIAHDCPRHSSEDALSEREFQLLLEGAASLRDPYAQQARFVILVAGRLGMRAGEIAHMDRSWIDWRNQMIVVPRHDPCTKARGEAGPCGYCKRLAEQAADHNPELSYEAALARAWTPKTDSAARSIPFDFDPRTDLVIERFFERYEKFPHSKQAVNRRVNKAAEVTDELDEDSIYPHCLRATAATYHASRGLSALPLQSMLGWSDLSTSQKYVRRSGEATARALRTVHRQ
ncbi:site-specific integrase [Halalkalicoccus jeotgali]|nr:site-specific integrase [Halalkalicoccus jeotgali]